VTRVGTFERGKGLTLVGTFVYSPCVFVCVSMLAGSGCLFRAN